MGPVVDDEGPGLGHAQVELVQGVQQRGVLPPVPQNPGLVLVQPPVLRQGLGVPGPQLADAGIQKPPAHRRSLPDEPQILRAEEHRVQHPCQLPGGFQPDAVGQQLPPGPPAQPGLQGEGALPGLHLPLDEGVVHPELDELFIVPGPVGGGGGQVGHGLQQIGLALGVFPPDDVDAWGEFSLKVGVVAEKVQGEGAEDHTTSSSTPSRAARSPGRSFLPRMVQVSPFTVTSPA